MLCAVLASFAVSAQAETAIRFRTLKENLVQVVVVGDVDFESQDRVEMKDFKIGAGYVSFNLEAAELNIRSAGFFSIQRESESDMRLGIPEDWRIEFRRN